jgi:inorganic phosphate transporter, PiT family
MESDLILVIVIATALAFDFTNGFHDTANVVATSISTRAMSPRLAVAFAAILNFVGAFISLKVAATVAKGIVSATDVTTTIIFAGLVGAIAWNLVTWYFGLPSSSTHALIGGLVGAAIVQSGSAGVQWHGVWEKVLLPGLASPAIGFVGAFILIVLIYRLFFRASPGVAHRGFRLGQLASGTWVAFTHGANDAQKTMGVIALALYTNGNISSFYVPTWVKIAAGLTIAAGTYAGGWRIIRTLGQRIYKLQPEHGFAAQVSAGSTLWLGTHYGFPISTTHVVTGAVLGAGATRRFSAIRWGLAGNIVVAWVLTLPAAGLVAAAFYFPVRWIF